MESLKIEYYEILEEEKLSNLKLNFDQMEDLESIKFSDLLSVDLFIQLNHKSSRFLISESESIDNFIKKFWEIEETSLDKPLSKEEEFCEMHFKNTHRHDCTGRFIVYMPVQEEELPTLGNSLILAQKRLNQTIKKLDKDPHMHKLYSEFLEEYESLGHMQIIPDNCYSPINYYLPHCGVFKSQNNSTKLRVVFDGSAPTTSGRSLNDILLSGRVQEDAFNIMLRFRKHKIVLTADIKQMFRQIFIDPSQRNLFRILWKNKHWEKPIEYELNTVLNTVTYGTRSTPFLAPRVIKQLCLHESDAFPLAAVITLSDIYMDDIVTGCENIENAKILKNQLIKMFKTCGMTLHKWNSNNSELLDIEYSIYEKYLFAQLEECTTKTLGMVWNSKSDTLNFKVSVKEKKTIHTKRVISTIAKLYAPFGLIGPVITKSKIFLQKLWLEKINWDDSLLNILCIEWNNFVSTLKTIENISINRYLLTDNSERIILLGYCDTSISAYGAVVYLRSYCENYTPTTKLIYYNYNMENI
ncbi:integrase catalytic domain-containing protein [Trichonephila clavipes]|nr:integrase catalytic domain-containing protein [Trichonephila clavipes]